MPYGGVSGHVLSCASCLLLGGQPTLRESMEERSDCASLVRQLQTEGRTLSFTPSLGKESLEYWPSKEGALHSLWNPTDEAPLRGLNNSTVNSPEILLQVSSSVRAVGKEGDEDEVTW